MFNQRRWTLAMCACLLAPASVCLADQLQLTGIIRDFKRGDQAGGHTDFETTQTVSGHGSYGHVINMLTMYLGEDGKPVFNPVRPSNDTMKSASSFASWYRDTQGVNLSMPYTITLSNGKTSPGGVYTYSTNAFFPIDNQLLGNQNQKDSKGVVRNFSFTYELHTKFSYIPGQTFTFIGDDDVWVYINKVKVMDLGGVHAAVNGTNVLLDGKVFITSMGSVSYAVDGTLVKQVDSAMATQLATLWTNLGLAGICPIKSGNRYIDLNLNKGGGDVKCTFAGSSVELRTGQPLVSAILKFSDNTTQRFSNLSGTSKTLSGTGAYAGRTVAGVWVKTGNAAGEGNYYSPDGAGSAECTLDFFFAERHVTESNFRIDTSMLLKPTQLSTVSPLYD